MPVEAPEPAPPPPTSAPAYAGRQEGFVNNLEPFAHTLDDLAGWSGEVPKGFVADFIGVLTDARFLRPWGIDDPAAVGGGYETSSPPSIQNGEPWFEAVDWVMAAREAKGRFVMMTLGACWGAQAVGSYRTLQLLNPMPSTLVAVEPVPENYEWIKQHFRNNGIDPDAHWLVPHAIADTIDPVLFPIGAAGSGAQNAIATNHTAARQQYVDMFSSGGEEATKTALSNLLLNNTTGIVRDLVEGYNFMAEIKLVSAITLRELLTPFERIDYLEADMQQSEIIVFPPFIDLLRKKVRRIHIGTHGKDVHWTLHDLFADNGWEIVFSFEPNARFDTVLGSFETNDGVLTVVNPDL